MLSLCSPLGSGSFGVVMRGTLGDGTPVAVKIIAHDKNCSAEVGCDAHVSSCPQPQTLRYSEMNAAQPFASPTGCCCLVPLRNHCILHP